MHSGHAMCPASMRRGRSGKTPTPFPGPALCGVPPGPGTRYEVPATVVVAEAQLPRPRSASYCSSEPLPPIYRPSCPVPPSACSCSGLLARCACKPTDAPPAPAVSPVAVPAEALAAIDYRHAHELRARARLRLAHGPRARHAPARTRPSPTSPSSSRRSASSRATPTAPTSRRCRSSASRVTNSPRSSSPRAARRRRSSGATTVVAWTKHVAPTASLDKSELVFVGYGVVAPEYNWDDYKGVDVKGKTLVMLVNDPPARRHDRKFGGRRMTYYGRWTYKYEQGAKKGAAGVLIVHETGPAGYPFDVVQGNAAEQFDLVTPDKNASRSDVEGWITLDQAKELFAMAGQDFDSLKARAATRDFKPVPLGVTAVDEAPQQAAHDRTRATSSRSSRAATPRIKDEYVDLHGALGSLRLGDAGEGRLDLQRRRRQRDRHAPACSRSRKAFTTLTTPPKRSILFLSVTAEEQGLLGSQYYAAHPLYPLDKTVADINMDVLNTVGADEGLHGDRTRRVGARRLRARPRPPSRDASCAPTPSRRRGSTTAPTTSSSPSRACPRSIRTPASTIVGKPAGYGMKKRDEYTDEALPQAADEMKPDWDLSGARGGPQALLHRRLSRRRSGEVPRVEAGQRVPRHAREADAGGVRREARGNRGDRGAGAACRTMPLRDAGVLFALAALTARTHAPRTGSSPSAPSIR